VRGNVMRRYSSDSRPLSHSRNFAPISAGSSLIEVMLAVAFMAVTALGLIAGQLWTAREARAMAMREQAAWIADSIAEAVRAPALADAATRQWNARAATLLPHGQSSVEVGAGVAVARVTWQAVRSMPANGEVIDKPESCGSADVPAGTSCVALAFSQ
jgi:Tfp pilus assembly protein PilV